MVLVEVITERADPKTTKSVKRGKGKRSKEAKKIKQSAAQTAVDKIRSKQQKKAARKVESERGTRGIIKINHIPRGFYEEEIRSFFKQFGRVLRIKVARSPKTGQPKGFAFVEFEYEEVAKIAAEAMNNYLMFNRLIKCKLLEDIDNSHKVFANNKIRADDYLTLRNREKAKEEQEAKNEVVKADFLAHKIKSLDKQHQRLAALGINFVYENPKIEEARQNPEVQDVVAKKTEIEAAEKHAEEILASSNPGMKVNKEFVVVFNKLKKQFPELEDEAILSTITELMPGVSSPWFKARKTSPAKNAKELTSASDALTRRQSFKSTLSKSPGKRLAEDEPNITTSPPLKRQSFGSPAPVGKKVANPESMKKLRTPQPSTPLQQVASSPSEKKLPTPAHSSKNQTPKAVHEKLNETKKLCSQATQLLTSQAKKSLTPKVKKSLTPQAKKSLTPQAKKSLTPQTKKSLTPQTKKSLTPQTKKSLTPQTKKSLTSPAIKVAFPKKTLTPEIAKVVSPATKKSLAPQSNKTSFPTRTSMTPLLADNATPRQIRKTDTPKTPVQNVELLVEQTHETPTRKKKKSLPKVSPKLLRSQARKSHVPEPAVNSNVTPAKDSPMPRKNLAKDKISRGNSKNEEKANEATPEVKPNVTRRKSVAGIKEVATIEKPKFSPKLLRSRNTSGAVGQLKVAPSIKTSRGRKSMI